MPKHTPFPWNWGYWRHVGKAAYKFVSVADATEEERDYGQIFLSHAQYGATGDPYGPKSKHKHILESVCSGYGGETDIIVSDADAMVIEKAPEMHTLLATAYELIIQYGDSSNPKAKEWLAQTKAIMAEIDKA